MNGDSSRERSETDAAEPRVQEIRIQCFREAEQHSRSTQHSRKNC